MKSLVTLDLRNYLMLAILVQVLNLLVFSLMSFTNLCLHFFFIILMYFVEKLYDLCIVCFGIKFVHVGP